MKARILALLLALVMVASLFAACSAGKTDASGASTGASQTTDDSKTTEDTKPAKTEKTKIVYWHAYTDQHEAVSYTHLRAHETSRSTARPCRRSATAPALTL